MDEEARRISEMTDEELEARWNAGTPTKVKRKPRADVAMTAKRMMDAVIERTEEDEPIRGTSRFTQSFLRLDSPQPVTSATSPT